jgi:hypothetical protein
MSACRWLFHVEHFPDFSLGEFQCVRCIALMFHVEHWKFLRVKSFAFQQQLMLMNNCSYGKDFIITPLITRLLEANYVFSY